MNDLERCDVLLVEKGLAPSRTRAQALIKAGFVFVSGEEIKKPAQLIMKTEVIDIKGDVCPYVSRGGFKLAKALSVFKVDPMNMVCLDVGASTGGFTDVLLKNGSKKVYALDVGTSQLSDILRNDPRVVVMEQTNARTIDTSMFDSPLNLAVMDVSFISIRLILPALHDVLTSNGALIALIKPQFEAGRNDVGKNGIVTNRKVHERVLRECLEYAYTNGWTIKDITFSPITGSDGNIEYLVLLIPTSAPQMLYDMQNIHDLVDMAFQAHK